MYDMLETFKTRIHKATQDALAEFEAEFNRRYSVMRGDDAKSPKVAAHDAIAAALDKLALQPDMAEHSATEPDESDESDEPDEFDAAGRNAAKGEAAS